MTSEPLVFTRKASGLVKDLTWWDVFLNVISAPAGSGIIYYSVSTVSTFPGGNVALCFLIGAVLLLPIVHITAVSANLVPRSGSLFVLIGRVVGQPLAFLGAALFFVGYTLSIGVVAFVTARLLGGTMVESGLASGFRWLQDLGERLQQPVDCAIGGAVMVLLTWLLVLRGIRLFRETMRFLFLVTVAAALAAVAIFYALPVPAGPAAHFNATWGAQAFERITAAAAAHGWRPPPFSWTATMNLLLVVLFSYGGVEVISYASGEVVREERKVRRGYYWGFIGLAATYMVIALAVTHAFGDFLGSYDFLFQHQRPVLASIMPAISPSVPFYVESVVPVWAGLTISIGLVLWLVTTLIPYFFSPSRLIFALAMDRVVPERLAAVNPRNGAPTWASHLTLLFALAGVLLNLANVVVVLGTILFCALFVYWLYGLSAALLPLRRPDLYRQLPPQRSWLGLPSLVWSGSGAFAVGWLALILSVRQLDLGTVFCLSALMGLALLLLFAFTQAGRRRGIDDERITELMPPD